MDSDTKLLVDLNLSAEVARAANLIVTRGEQSDLSTTAAHLCGALGLVLFAMSKPGTSSDCIPGLVDAMQGILLRLESIERLNGTSTV